MRSTSLDEKTLKGFSMACAHETAFVEVPPPSPTKSPSWALADRAMPATVSSIICIFIIWTAQSIGQTFLRIVLRDCRPLSGRSPAVLMDSIGYLEQNDHWEAQ
jgi:hypothetical protein